MIDYEVVFYFGFEYGVNVPPKVGRVREAASVERPGCLLEGGEERWVGLGRSGWSGDERKCSIPNFDVSCTFDNVAEKRHRRSNIEIAR
jgi:hypothetical protein